MSDPDARKSINALLKELRSWDVDEERYTLRELAAKFGLDLFVVQRIAASEDMDIEVGALDDEAEEEDDADPNATTIDLDPDQVREAIAEPDPSPDWVDEDVDTGVWRKKPTGEWERVNED